ncbi:MAG: hypothetical protein R2864_12405 [Syntrophotaleaceae bacterium]
MTLASAGTFLHTGLKVPYFIWFGKNNCKPETWEKAADPSWNMIAAMAIGSVLCIFIGVYTPYLYDMLPYLVDYNPYTSYHISESMQILLFTMLGFFLLLKKLQPAPAVAVDTDWFYRRGARVFRRWDDRLLNGLNAWCEMLLLRRILPQLGRFFEAPGGHLQIAGLRLLARFGIGRATLAASSNCVECRSRLGSYPVGIGVLLAVLYLAVMSLLFFF